jgi:hypothetical protein
MSIAISPQAAMNRAVSQQAAMDNAVRHLVNDYSPLSTRIGWLMLASIWVEAWDMYGIAFVLIFIREQFHPDPLLLGLAAAATQGGAVIGALVGGWLNDKLGRRVMFLSTMIVFIVLAAAQAFVTSVGWLVVVRLFLGIPLGSDPPTGITYIMECMPKGKREVMGNRWQFMLASGQAMVLAVVTLFLFAELPHELVWRAILGLGAVPALLILLMRRKLPETAMWLIRQGRIREAKRVAVQLYNDNLDMLPDEDIVLPKPRPTAFLADIRKDSLRWRATLYGWIACTAQASQFTTFAFYIPVIFVMVGVSSVLGTNLITLGLFILGSIAAWTGPLIMPKIGQRGIGIAGFGLSLVGLLIAAAALYSGHIAILPFGAAILMWGEYWANNNVMVLPTMVAKPQYRGTASGIAYMFCKLPSFCWLFLFPSLFTAIGQANATLFVCIFPLAGLLAAIFILKEVYGFDQD